MNKVKVYKLEIEFPLAFFKISYTVKTRKTYLIPRKKAIISIFNTFFEKPISFWKIKKNKLLEEEKIVKDFLVGAELIEYNKTTEIQRIIQIKNKSTERPPSETELITNVKYVFYLIPKNTSLNIYKNPINYYPFAGQNDYLAITWKLDLKEGNILEKTTVNLLNYQLIPFDYINLAKQPAEMIIENALEKCIIAKGSFNFQKPIQILEVDGREIILF